jgi:hypothetical protein
MKPMIEKIFIPTSVRPAMLNNLNTFGFDDQLIFPDSEPQSAIAKNRLSTISSEILNDEDEFIRRALKQS